LPHSQEIDADDVLVVRDLNVAFRQQQETFSAVRQLSFTLRRGETLAIVGESGSGKSVTALALMRLLDRAVSEVSSEALWLRRRNRQVVSLSEQSAAGMRSVRGADMAMIFQEPMTSLNPVFTIGEQIAESIRLHQGLGHDAALREAKKMLDQVRIPEAETMLSRYPHQLSGGMRQRVMIAMALSCRPAVLIADEPTTALDVTIQAQILQLIAVLQKEMAMGVIFITHDMGVVADIADRVLVMYRGEAVESGTVEEIFRAPQHPYTQALLAAVPRLGSMRGSDLPRHFPLLQQAAPDEGEQNTVVAGEPILKVRDLVARFPLRSGILNRVTREVHAVEKVSFDLWPERPSLWSASPAAGSQRPAGRCCGWWRRRAAPSSLTASGLIRWQTANFRRCAAISSLFSRIRLRRSTRDKPWAIRLWSRCAYGMRRGRGARARRLAAGAGRFATGTCLALSARVFRRPAPAYLHRPRAGAQSESGDCRRGRVSAGCFHPRADY
jgi:ABC-type dipeptide/oligopeptide/nickel transport system ATPase component